MAMRELVTGGAACAVPGSSSCFNPLGALADALFGSSCKTQERLKEIPVATPTGSENQFLPQTAEHLGALPGAEQDRAFLPPNAQGSEFLRNFHSTYQNDLADVWDEVQHGPLPPLYADTMVGIVSVPPLPPTLQAGPSQRMLLGLLHSFVNSSHGGIPFHPTQLPPLGLSEGDKQCIRDRSTIMARHFFADKSEDFIRAQVNALLHSLDIDSDARARGPLPGKFQELEDYWNESQGIIRPRPHVADGWANEFNQLRVNNGDPESWARSFEQQHGANGWASEFEQMSGANAPNIAAVEQTWMITHTLAQNNDPKFQLVSKMSRGELLIDDNQVKPASGDSASEFQQQHNADPSWADEYLQHRGPEQWANEFAAERHQHGSVDDHWVNEFSKLNVNDWADEFRQQIAKGALGESAADDWVNAYDEYFNEQVAMKQQSDTSRGVYVFSDMNPYVGHPDPLKKGQELFSKGLLSEAILALEAEVMKNPNNSEGLRLLGIAHAENDDDQQAIAAMMKAEGADPSNLEVLLALGVSHTNELEQTAALRYLYAWLHHHLKYKTLTSPEIPMSLYHADVVGLFNDAAQMSPEDADVHIALGVLYNLSREYDRAIASFQTALKLRPGDYSLWNKLGATQANCVQSADAVLAYQRALDLKPNYVRAWANMGISYANQGMYEDSIRYYVRALAMNPKADSSWQYLRISLSSASRHDMLEACDSRNLDVLQKEFPL